MLLVDPEAESADVDDPEVDGLGWRRRGVAEVDIFLKMLLGIILIGVFSNFYVHADM